jgi:hypothetical protein
LDEKQINMKTHHSIQPNVLRLLYAHSGNCCAFEGCHSPIFEDDGTLTGECCHIEANSPNGPRYNEKQTNEERNGYDNLVLMCARHHKIIDSRSEQYTVEKIKALKQVHENKYTVQQLEATDIMIKQLQIESEKYWSSLRAIEQTDDTGFKMELGENDLCSLMKDIKEIYEGLQSSIDIVTESSWKLQDDLKTECEKCGIDYSIFDKIPYYNNSLFNRDWEIINLSFPNHMTLLKNRYLQLCVNLLEKLVIYNQEYLNILNVYKKELTLSHKSAYYID